MMLKYQLNQLDFTIRCSFDGPFLIREGRFISKTSGEGEREKYPDSIFISRSPDKDVQKIGNDPIAICHSDNNLQYYVPASSIRGLIRSHAERIMRSVSPDGDLYACDPFDNDSENDSATGCSKRLQNLPDNATPAYKYACAICRLFGAGGLASRIRFSDGELEEGYKIRLIDGNAIDRFTGGTVSGALFKNQALEKGAFSFKITLRNFELWQIGLLAFVFRDLELGKLQLGSGKTKGFGSIKGKITSGRLSYWRKPEGNRLSGFDDLMPSLRETYDTAQYRMSNGSQPAPDMPVLNPIAQDDALSIETHFNLPVPGDSSLTNIEFWQICAAYWKGCNNNEAFPTITELQNMIAIPVEESSEPEIQEGG